MDWLWIVGLCFGLLVWRYVGPWEWSIPVNLQKHIVGKVEEIRLGQKTFDCFWQINPENPMAEWYIWNFRRIIPEVDIKLRANFYIVLGTSLQKPLLINMYLACLQRRFPEIEIKLKLEDHQI